MHIQFPVLIIRKRHLIPADRDMEPHVPVIHGLAVIEPFRWPIGAFARCGGGDAVADEDGGFLFSDEVVGVGEDDGEDYVFV